MTNRLKRFLICSGLGASVALAVAAPIVVDARLDNDAHSERVTERAAAANRGSEVLLQKMQALQEEMQKLRGQLEVQQHDLKLLNDQQRALYTDLDQRVAKLSVQSSSTTISAAAVSTPATPATLTDAQAYQAAYDLIRHKQFDVAGSALRTFVDAFPDSVYLANAHYWLGELSLNNGALDNAIKEFSIVVNQYPKSNKAPAALLKIGFTYYDKGLWQQSKDHLQQVKSKYPTSSSAQLASAKLAELNQKGL